MCAMSSELQQYMTGLTNEISRGHFDEAVRLGEKALAMEELHGKGNKSLLGEIYRNMRQLTRIPGLKRYESD